jgi:serine/threonine-protein kinase
MLDGDGNVHVADFGIASAAGMDALTMTGTVLGTVGYLSPEQAQGDRATAASDRYALAVVAYELLTGARPFEADSPTAEASAHVHASVPSICDRSGALPCELDPVFERALAKDPAQRYATCADFVAALHGALADAAGTTQVLPPPAPRPVTSPALRGGRLWPVAIALVVLAALGGALAAWLLTDTGNDKSANQAPQQPRVTTVVRTVTAEGRTTTVHERVTTPAPPPATSTASTSTPASALGGHTLNDQGYQRMQAGDYDGALPLLQQAVQKLSGVGPADAYEGYANFNLGYTLVQLGQCADAIPYLEHSQELQPDRHPEPRRTLNRARACA